MTPRPDSRASWSTRPVRRAHGSCLRRGRWVALLGGIGGRLRTGKPTVETPSGQQLVFGRQVGGAHGVAANPPLGGQLLPVPPDPGRRSGSAESDMDGRICWSPDLWGLIEPAVRNEAALGSAIMGTVLLLRSNWWRHFYRAKTRRGSRRNIVQHDDPATSSNCVRSTEHDLFLGHLSGGETLEEAQAAKIDRAIGQLGSPAASACLRSVAAGRLARPWSVVTAAASPDRPCPKAARPCRGAARQGRPLRPRRDLLARYPTRRGCSTASSRSDVRGGGRGEFARVFEVVRERLARAAARRRKSSPSPMSVPRPIAVPPIHPRYIFPGGMLPSPSVLREQIARAGLSLASLQISAPATPRPCRNGTCASARLDGDRGAGLRWRFKRMWNITWPIARPDSAPAPSMSASIASKAALQPELGSGRVKPYPAGSAAPVTSSTAPET